MKKSKISLSIVTIMICSLGFFFVSCSAGESAFATEAKVRIFLTFRGQKFSTYNEASPWTAPDGKIYNKGEKLPVFTHIEKKLQIEIEDTTPKSGQTGRELFDAAAATGFKEAELYQGDPRRISNEGINGRFIPLNKHFDKLPNFAAFLDANPSIKSQLTQADGNIYMTPYFDDINKLERMFLMRIDWVKKLLDEPNPLFDTSRSITPVYRKVYNYASGKKVSPGEDNLQTLGISENIIDIQNSLNIKNGAALAQALRDYIDANYMNSKTNYKSRSDLFVSSKAAYDADELVALMRAVKTNPVYLTGEDRNLIIFFPRDIKSYAAMRYLASGWGCRGLVKADDLLVYLTKNNTIQDVRLTDAFYKAYSYITQLYKEGLVLADFDQPRGKIDIFRTYCFQTNDGFISCDYAASTVSQHDLLPPEDLAKFGTRFEPVVPPAAQWFSEEFEHYSESNRSIKPDGGWGIVSTATGKTLTAALKLLDYPFSKEGLEVMTFGPKGLYWKDYIKVAGEEVPELIPRFYEDILSQTQGNWSNFLRGFVGATLPAGHVKNTIAIESQISNDHYKNGIERIASSGMTLASLSTNVSPERRLAPTIVPLDENQVEALNLNTFQAYFVEWETRIMKFGFGGKMENAEETVPTTEKFKTELIERGLEQTISIYNLAFDKVKN